MIDEERGTSPDDVDVGSFDFDALPPSTLEIPYELRASTILKRIDESDRAQQILALGGVLETRAPSAPTIPHDSYLGASDVGAILGLDPMRTPLDVWCEKTHRVTFASSLEIEAGNDHEAAVVAGFARRMRRLGLVERVEYPGPGTIRNLAALDPGYDGRPWRGATLDGIVHHRDHGPCCVEAKLVGAGQAHAWGPEPAGAEGIPARTLAQIHWQTMHAREHFGGRWPVGYVAADIGGTDRRVYEIPIDDEMITDMLDAGREWWKRHVIGGEMPRPTARDVHTLGIVFPHASRPLSPFVPLIVRELAEAYDCAREITARHVEERERIGAELRAAIGDATGYTWHGGKVTWREDAHGGRRLHVRIWRAE